MSIELFINNPAQKESSENKTKQSLSLEMERERQGRTLMISELLGIAECGLPVASANKLLCSSFYLSQFRLATEHIS